MQVWLVMTEARNGCAGWLALEKPDAGASVAGDGPPKTTTTTKSPETGVGWLFWTGKPRALWEGMQVAGDNRKCSNGRGGDLW